VTDRDYLEAGALVVGALVIFAHLALAVGLGLAAGTVLVVGLLVVGLWRSA
jgi:hypothetical protein